MLAVRLFVCFAAVTSLCIVEICCVLRRYLLWVLVRFYVVFYGGNRLCFGEIFLC